MAVVRRSGFCPPGANRIDGETRRIAADADADETFIAHRIVDPVGNADPIGI